MKVLFEDPAYLAVEKPYGVLSEWSESEESLPAALCARYGAIFPVHRLDRAVGGVMVYARTKAAAARLCAAVSAGEIKKEYLAVVSGTPEPAAGELRDFLFKDSRQNKSFVVDGARKGAREAILTYETLAAVNEGETPLSLVRVRLLTGRSHQIRVQFAARGWPLAGDGKYGSRQKAPHIALFSAKLTFPEPTAGKLVSFAAAPPAEYPWTAFSLPPFEIERKFLVRMPDVAVLAAQKDAERYEITQTYLLAPNGETKRVRRTVREGNVTYTETRKYAHAGIRCVEEERTLTAAEYEALLAEADPARRPIVKTRWRLPYRGHTVEVDLYPFWQDRAIAEVELTDEAEPCPLPPYLALIREVSGDKRYKNVQLAQEVPHDPLDQA